MLQSPRPGHNHFERGSKLNLLELKNRISILSIVGFSLLHVLPFLVNAAGGHDIRPTNLHQKTFVYPSSRFYARRSSADQSYALKDDAKRPVNSFQNSQYAGTVRNRRMFNHQDAPGFRFDGTSYGTEQIASHLAGTNDIPGGTLFPTFDGENDTDDDEEDKNPWINADDYAILLALRWTGPEDYDEAVLSPFY